MRKYFFTTVLNLSPTEQYIRKFIELNKIFDFLNENKSLLEYLLMVRKKWLMLMVTEYQVGVMSQPQEEVGAPSP